MCGTRIIGMLLLAITVLINNVDTARYCIAEYPELLSGLQILNTTRDNTEIGCAKSCNSTNGCTAFMYKTSVCLLLDNQSIGYRRHTPYVYRSGDDVHLMAAASDAAEMRILGYRFTRSITDDFYAKYIGKADSGDVRKGGDLYSARKTTFKHLIMERLSDLDIDKVVISVADGSDVKRVIAFDGKNVKDKYMWFDKSRIIENETSWIDLRSTTKTKFFSIQGNSKRRFFINEKYVSCPDVGWLAVVTKPFCQWEMKYKPKPSNPMIMYSKNNMKVTWGSNSGVAVANGLHIEVVHKHRCGCDDGWTLRDGNCYRFIQCSHQFDCYHKNVTEYCAKHNAVLVMVKSDADNEFMATLANRMNGWIMISGNYKPIEARWVWPDYTTLTYSNWYTGKPDKREHCIVISREWSNQWNSVRCDQRLTANKDGFVCQKDNTRVID